MDPEHRLASQPEDDVWILSHRGDRSHATENTVEAFDAAIHRGADGVELDLSKDEDGRWVTAHAGHVARSRIDREAPKKEDDPYALDRSLGALFDWAATHPDVVLNIELKEPGGEEELLAHCRRFIRRLLVTSYTVDALWALHEVAPEVPTGLIAHYGSDVNVRVARLLAAEWVVWRDRYVDEELISATERAGLRAFVWEVDDPDRLQELAGWGVHGVITDDVAGLLGH